MIYSKPLITSELGSGVNFVNQSNVTGLSVPPKNPQALASAIEMLLNNKEMKKQKGESAYQRFLQHFLLDHVLQLSQSLYEQDQIKQRKVA